MKTRNKIIIIVGSITLLLGGVFGGHYLYSENYKINVPDKITLEKPTKTLTTKGRGIYDTDGNKVVLNGINYGNWLIQEEWMSVNSIGPTRDEQGNLSIKDGVVNSYLEMTQEDLDLAFENNPNLTKDQVKAIAEQKMEDLNAASVEAAMSMVAGTARSMGVVVVD